VEGEGHTLCNLLKSSLLEDKDVEFASYNISHPLISNPIISIKTNKNEKPEKALKLAIEKILKKGELLRKEFNNSLKNFNSKILKKNKIDKKINK
jgi:DNA-directed RNA polymerase subunit L